MPLALPRYTIDDLESFPDDGNRYELVDGLLLVTPAPLPLHQVVLTRIYLALGTYFSPRGPAHVFSPGSVEVAPDLHLEPDILVVPVTGPMSGRWTAVRTWWLAVEVSGRGSRVYDREYKRPAYLRAGVREVWRADLAERCILVARPDAPDERRSPTELGWHPPEMPAPLTLDVPRVFEGVQADW
jgi:Uma2 family endonuclease